MNVRNKISAIIALIIIFCFTGCASIDNHTPEEQNSQPPKVLNLGVTLEEFKTAYNQNALNRNVSQLLIGDIEFGKPDSSGEKTFGYKFIDTFYLLGTVDDKNFIKEVCITKALVSNEDRQTEAQVAALAFLIMVQTLSPDLSSNARAEILNKIATSKPYAEVTQDNFIYSQSLLENGKILMLSAKPKDVKK